jgi:hypothetical protein
MLKIGFNLFVLLFLVACASSPPPNIPLDETFVTTIEENHLKLFVFSVTPPGSPGKDGQPMGQVRHSGRPPVENSGSRSRPDKGELREQMKEIVYSRLDARLSENGFCRDGYITLESFIDYGKSRIRGECVDGATEEDYEKFPNSEAQVKSMENIGAKG